MSATPARVRKPPKRSASPASNGQNVKKKRPTTPQGQAPPGGSTLPAALAPDVDVVNSNTSSPAPSETSEKKEPVLIFKNSNFVHSTKGSAANKKSRVWKNLKQIIAAERQLTWKPDDVTYGSADAPPSFNPAKKYSDITGLVAKYKDPHSKIRYATTEEFARIQILPSDIVAGYLTLRKANAPVP